MMYGIIGVLAVLVLILFFVNDKQVKRAALCMGLTVCAVMFFMHYIKMVHFTGPVLALGIAAVAVLVFAVLTVISFIKK